MRPIIRTLLVTSLAAACAACGSSDDQETEKPDPIDPGPEGLLAAPEPGEGFQIDLEPFEVPSGEELYYCYRVPVPADVEVDVATIEARFTLGAHHMLALTVDETYEADQGECSAGTLAYGLSPVEAFTKNLRFLSGAQTPYSEDPRMKLDLEDGMAFRVRKGSTLFFQIHWFNVTPEPQQAKTVVNFEYAEAEPEKLLESFFFYHTDINLPPRSPSEVAGRCTFPEDSEIVGMVSHMHQRGVNFTTHKYDEAMGDLVYEEASWAEPIMKYWRSPDLLQVPSGSALEYRCFFENTTDDWIGEGDGANDEMCMLIGMYTGGSRTLFGFPGAGSGNFPNPCVAVP